VHIDVSVSISNAPVKSDPEGESVKRRCDQNIVVCGPATSHSVVRRASSSAFSITQLAQKASSGNNVPPFGALACYVIH
jgi:hypothetical protein